jgi:membrane-associated phospholipid phosphatase
MMIASTLAGAAVNTLRLTTGRTRPVNTEAAQGWYGPSKIGQYKFNSFPSGHTATAAGAGFILLFSKSWLAFCGIFFALLMAVARISTGSHHPSDTAFALVFALAAADYVKHWLLPRLAYRFGFLRAA